MRGSGDFIEDSKISAWLTTLRGNKRRGEVQTRENGNELDTQTRRYAGRNIWLTIRNRDVEPRREPGKRHRFRSWLCRDDALVYWSRLDHLSRIAGREKSPRMKPHRTPAFEEQVAEPVKKNNHRSMTKIEYSHFEERRGTQKKSSEVR